MASRRAFLPSRPFPAPNTWWPHCPPGDAGPVGLILFKVLEGPAGLKLCSLYFAKCFYSPCFSFRCWGRGPSPGGRAGSACLAGSCQGRPVAVSAGHRTLLAPLGEGWGVREHRDRIAAATSPPPRPDPTESPKLAGGFRGLPQWLGLKTRAPGSSPHTVPPSWSYAAARGLRDLLG